MSSRNKKRNKRTARKRALGLKHGISEDSYASRDSIRACRRNYGQGKSNQRNEYDN